MVSSNGSSSPLPWILLFSQYTIAHYNRNCCFRDEEAGTQKKRVKYSGLHRIAWLETQQEQQHSSSGS